METGQLAPPAGAAAPEPATGVFPGGAAPSRHGPADLAPSDPATVGPYTLLARLGSGGMGTVYLGVDGTGRHVAVKAIRAELARVAEFRAALQREAESARRVARFCTAAVLDVNTLADPPYLVVEYVDGPTLADAVTSRGPLSQAELHQLAVSITTALTAIHRAGIVHRDLNPSNILLSRLGPKVIDFGIARALGSASILTGDRPIGTPAFMAPEQARGHPVTSAADVFAWGGVLVFAGSGRPPFGRGPATSLLDRTVNDAPDLDGLEASLRPLVEDAMRKNPADRPTAEELYMRLLDLRPDPDSPEGPVGGVDLPLGGVAALARPLTTPSPRLADAGNGAGGAPAVPTLPRLSTPPWVPECPWTAKTLEHGRPGGAFGDIPTREPGHQSTGGPRDMHWTDDYFDDTSVTLDPVEVGGATGHGSRVGSAPPTSLPSVPSVSLPPARRAAGRRRLLALVAMTLLAVLIFFAVRLAAGVSRPGAAHNPDDVAANALRLLATDAAPARRLALAAYRAAPESRATRTALVAAFGAGTARTTARVGTGAVLAAVFRPDGRVIASGGTDGTVTLWDVAHGRWPIESATLYGHTDRVYSIAFDPTGTKLASGGADGTVTVWDVTDPKNARRRSDIRSGTGEVRAVAFSADGRTLTYGSAGGTVALWDVTDPARPVERAALDGHTGGIHSLAFAARGSLLAFVGDDGAVRVWDVHDEAHLVEWGLTGGRGVQSVAFDGSGTVLASAGPEGMVRLWGFGDAAYPMHPTERATLGGFVDAVRAVAFSPDRTFLAVGGGDGTVSLASVSSPARLTVLRSHTQAVSAVGFSPDGKTLLSGGDDGTLKLWDLDPERLAAGACRVPGNQISRDEWAGNFGELPYDPPC